MGVTDMDSPIYTNGVIRVCVPSGWKLFKGIDSGGKETSDKVHIYKNIDLKTDLFRKAGIIICYYGEDVMYLQTRDFYDNLMCEGLLTGVGLFRLTDDEWVIAKEILQYLPIGIIHYV